jgi:hypothetical protein
MLSIPASVREPRDVQVEFHQPHGQPCLDRESRGRAQVKLPLPRIARMASFATRSNRLRFSK